MVRLPDSWRFSLSASSLPENPLPTPSAGVRMTSPVRASSATAPRLPDADQTARGPVVGREISRFPCQERACMPGSLTTPDRPGARAGALARVAFRFGNSVGIRNYETFAAQWLACTVPCRLAMSLGLCDRLQTGGEVFLKAETAASFFA